MMRQFAACAVLAACSQRPALPAPTLPLTPSPDATFRAQPPPVEVTPLTPPEVRSAELANGMRILVVERPALPLVSLAWASQSARDSPALHERGLAALTARALTQGTELTDGRVLAHLRINGESPAISVGEDGTILHVHTPAAGLSVAAEILAATVRRPKFTPQGIQVARADQLETMLWHSLHVDRELRAAALLALFGPEHPPVTPFGRHADVLSFTQDAVSQFHAAHYGPDNSALVAVGAVNLEQMVELAQRDFGDWPRSEAPAPVAARPAPLASWRPVQGLAGGGDQARFAVALPCPPPGGTPEADFDLLAMVLANLPLSRATRLLRHEEGIAYAITARCEQTGNRGMFWVEFGVEPQHGGHALALVLDQMQRLRTEGVPSRELDLAKIQLLGHFGGALSTNEGVLKIVTIGFLRGQAPDDFARWIENVQTATSSRIRETAKQYFTGRVAIATYGPRDAIEAGLGQFQPAEWRPLPLQGDD
jgi:zinc protease